MADETDDRRSSRGTGKTSGTSSGSTANNPLARAGKAVEAGGKWLEDNVLKGDPKDHDAFVQSIKDQQADSDKTSNQPTVNAYTGGGSGKTSWTDQEVNDFLAKWDDPNLSETERWRLRQENAGILKYINENRQKDLKPGDVGYRPEDLADANVHAAEIARQAAEKAAERWKQFNTQVRADFKPYTDFGLDVLNEIQEGMDSGRWNMPEWGGYETDLPEWQGYETEIPEWDPDAFVFEKDPGYQFRLDEGLKAIRRGMNAHGMGGSGATLKAAARYSQDYASNEYGKARDRAVEDWRNKRQVALDNRAGELTAHMLDTDRAKAMRSAELLDYNISRENIMHDYNLLAGQVGVGLSATDMMSRYGAMAAGGTSDAEMTAAAVTGAGWIGAENAKLQAQAQRSQSRSNSFNNLLSFAGLAFGLF